MLSLKQRFANDMKLAMKARDKASLRTIRMIIAAIKHKEIDERIELDDALVVSVLKKMTKQRQDSQSQFLQAGRSDLAAIEDSELLVINNYLPKQLNEAQILPFVEQAIEDTNASSMKDIGKIMGKLNKQLGVRADMGVVVKLIKSKLV